MANFDDINKKLSILPCQYEFCNFIGFITYDLAKY